MGVFSVVLTIVLPALIRLLVNKTNIEIARDINATSDRILNTANECFAVLGERKDKPRSCIKSEGNTIRLVVPDAPSGDGPGRPRLRAIERSRRLRADTAMMQRYLAAR